MQAQRVSVNSTAAAARAQVGPLALRPRALALPRTEAPLLAPSRCCVLASRLATVVVRSSARGKTPYQGPKRVFGYFRCSCGRYWASGFSWANKGQECKGCGKRVYPFEQRPLEKGRAPIDTTKPHPAELCEKCQELGYPCTELRESSSLLAQLASFLGGCNASDGE